MKGSFLPKQHLKPIQEIAASHDVLCAKGLPNAPAAAGPSAAGRPARAPYHDDGVDLPASACCTDLCTKV